MILSGLVNFLQLKKIEAYGFKSFADRIDVDFDKGITAIVGPNGSGKSNISDAIKWVLGEQNVRNLRGTKAEDIIFNGSDSRRAMGVAEVSLFFANDGTLPVDFNEVVVTRRLFRNGESEFYINKSRCRLKDIVNLFADTGIGYDSMGIISQNKMDEILNAKPEERRLFFEEAAGITKYRNRKRESMRKLEDTEANLQRVYDITGEIENQLEPLRLSAEKAQKHQKLKEELASYQLTGEYHRYLSLQEKRGSFDAAMLEKKDQELAASTAVQLIENRKIQLDNSLLELEKHLEELSRQKNEIHEKLEAADSQIRVLEERRSQNKANRQRFKQQLHENQSMVTEARSDIASLETAGKLAQKQQAEKSQELEQKRAKGKAARESLMALKQKCADGEQQKQKLMLELAEKSHQLEAVEKDIAGDSEKRSEQLSKLQEMQDSLRTAAAKKTSLEQQQAEITAELGAVNTRLQELAGEKQRLELELRQSGQERQQLERSLQGHNSRLQIMEKLQQGYEGFGRAVKGVLKSNEPWRSGVCGAVAELLDVPNKYITAIETALGGSLQNIVTEDTNVAKGAIEYLKRQRLGRATFLPLNSIVVRQRQEGLPDMAGVIGWANDIITTEARYQKVAEFLLGRTLVVDTLDNALAIAKAYNQRLRIVTLEGELLSPGGALAGGSRQHQENSFLNRQGEIAQLQEVITQEKTALTELQGKLQLCQKNIAQSETDMQQATENRHQMEIRQRELSLSIQQYGAMADGLSQELQMLEKSTQEAEGNYHKLLEEQELLKKQYKELEEKQQAQTRALEIENLNYAQLEEEAEELSHSANALEQEKTVLEQQVIRAREQMLLRQRELQRLETNIGQLTKDLTDLENDLTLSMDKISELLNSSQSAQKAFNAVKAEYDTVYQKRMAQMADSKNNDKEIKEANKRLTGIQEQLHRLELDASKVDYDIEQCQENMLSQFGLVPERVAEVAVEIEPGELKRKLKELESVIRSLGVVNPNAPKEYEDLKERHSFLSVNAEDLEKAKADLLEIITKLETTMTQQFTEAFAKINEYFGEIFVQLFGGGQAYISLSDKDKVLESGVNIVVTIPGKKTQNLAVLSGGERALTVVALLFSFLKYRPSPFSVLDEIDAPLDEANIGRFGSFLKEYAEHTQFIIVTHRKGTMEAADAMYGVTIETAGVSKLLSVKLKDAAEEYAS